MRPAYTLIHYGTNDWNMGECKFNPPCFTIDSLRTMVRDVKGRSGLPILATIIPANPIYLETQPERNQWIAAMNVRIKDMARTLKRIRDERGLSIVVSEQVLSFALAIADRVLVIDRGHFVHESAGKDIDEKAVTQLLSI